MAYFEIDFPDDFLSEVLKTDSEELIKEMLFESIPIVTESIRKEILNTHPGTGKLAKSIKSWKPYKNKDGVWKVSSAPMGKDKKLKKSKKVYSRSKSETETSGTALFNTDKLWWIEYGNARQPPKPILDRATNNASEKVIKKMQEIYEKKVGAK